MKKQLLLILLLAFANQNLFAQKQSWNWYFGAQAAVKFDSILPPVALTNSAMTNIEGVASISDYNGNLLFYTDGMNVYDSTHQHMPNGYGLSGNSSSTQSAIIVRKPSSDSLYYIFTVDFLGGGAGLSYSTVDMSLNGGLGDVFSKNNLMHLYSREKLTAIRHGNKKDFWVLVIDWATDDIYSYLVDSTGVNLTPVISPMDSLQMQITNASTNRANGYMKANRQGTRIAMALWNANSYDLFDFNDTTGVVSNHIKIQSTLGSSSPMSKTYGVEFSPDGTKLYGTTCDNNPTSKLLQFDLTAGTPQNIYNTRDTIALVTSSSGYYYMALQIAPDGKIYCSLNGESFLGAINYPDSTGAACGYVNNAVSLNGKMCKYGLPNFLVDYVLPISTTGVNEVNEKNGYRIYPNPVKNELNIILTELPHKKATFILSDLLGRKLQEVKLISTNTTLIVDQPNGIYYATIVTDTDYYTSKIIIQR